MFEIGLRAGLWYTLAWLLCLPAWSLPAGKDSQVAASNTDEWSYTTRSWQAQNGLPGEIVQAFAQTPNGLLWVGTSEGLLRFDGAQFTRFSRENTPAIHENSVFCLLAARDGDLWIGTDGGGLIEMRDGVFRAITASDGLTDEFIRVLFEDHLGHLWVATDSGLFTGSNGKFIRVDDRPGMPPTAFHGLAEDGQGRVWAGAAQMYAIENGSSKEYALFGSDSRNRVKSILETADGSVWVGTVSGLHRMRPGSGSFERVSGVWGTVRTLCAVSPDELWAGTIGDGIFRIRFGGAKIEVSRLTAPSPLVSNTVLSIFADADRNLWVGTQVGMIRLTRTPVHVLFLPAAADSDFGTVSMDVDGSLWAAGNQLVHVVGEQVLPVHFRGLSDAHVRNVLRTRDGALWTGTDGSGLFRIAASGTVHYTVSQGLVNNFVRGMLEARDGTLWIGTDSGLSHLDRGIFQNFTMANGLSHFSIRSLLEDRNGDVWIGTERGVTHLHKGAVIHDAATSALEDEKVWAEHEDEDGGLWFGTRSNGLFRYRDGKSAHFTTANGLASDDIYSILEDKQHRIWLSGPLGVTRLNRDELDRKTESAEQSLSLHVYRADAGDKPTRFYGGTQSAGVMARNGDAWFPTNQGLWRISPTDAETPELSHLNIGEIRVDGRAMARTAQLVLAAAQSRLEINYEPVLLNSQQELKFRYRLESFDQDWTQANSQERTATYTNLPAGAYTFTVEAWEVEHPEHVIRVSQPIVKRPYFYRTPWFIATCALGLALISMLAYRLRMKQVHGRFQAVLAERTRLAREMHDTLIQGCASVSAMLEAAAVCDEDDSVSRQHLIEYASTQIQATMDEARQAVWNLRGGEQAPSDLATCIQQMGERISREFGIQVECHSHGEPFSIAQQATHELMMVAREALFNSVLHGHPKAIRAGLKYSGETLEMVILDDGVGFDPATVAGTAHYGLQGLRERVHRYGGDVEIESKPGQGTRVLVTIPKASLSL
jgi:ligand-binding sensor domain-containing protein/signal transduction histidine kinase